jgi:DNA repair protein RadC
VLAIADDFLAACGGLAGLAGCDLDVIRGQKLGAAQAASLMAAVELGRRLARGALPPEPLEDPARVARHLYLRYHRLDQEVMGALYLDSRHRRVGESELFRGTWARMLVEPRPILREAIRRNAQGILLFHLHPSGDPTPSQEDKVFTERMRRCCEHMGFDLLDHLILGGERWLSLRRLVPW